MTTMRKSSFHRPKMVLIFNGAQILVAIARSLHSAAELTGGNLQAISFCCTGKYICSGSFYYRHLHPDVEVDISDIGTLQLQEYDSLCGVERTYYSVRQMAHKRALIDNKKKNKSSNNSNNDNGK